MQATLSWLDLTTSDRDKVRRVLDLFNEQGTVDELGLGSLRDTISNALFPGNSLLHAWVQHVLRSWSPGHQATICRAMHAVRTCS